jgi:replication-associated recombination protein RarA
MIFYGKPGLGKTSAARTIIELVGQEHTEINPSSLLQNVESLRRGIDGFVTTCTTTDYKICFIDEADYLPNKLQDGVRSFDRARAEPLPFSVHGKQSGKD